MSTDHDDIHPTCGSCGCGPCVCPDDDEANKNPLTGLENDDAFLFAFNDPNRPAVDRPLRVRDMFEQKASFDFVDVDGNKIDSIERMKKLEVEQRRARLEAFQAGIGRRRVYPPFGATNRLAVKNAAEQEAAARLLELECPPGMVRFQDSCLPPERYEAEVLMRAQAARLGIPFDSLRQAVEGRQSIEQALCGTYSGRFSTVPGTVKQTGSTGDALVEIWETTVRFIRALGGVARAFVREVILRKPVR